LDLEDKMMTYIFAIENDRNQRFGGYNNGLLASKMEFLLEVVHFGDKIIQQKSEFPDKTPRRIQNKYHVILLVPIHNKTLQSPKFRIKYSSYQTTSFSVPRRM